MKKNNEKITRIIKKKEESDEEKDEGIKDNCKNCKDEANKNKSMKQIKKPIKIKERL